MNNQIYRIYQSRLKVVAVEKENARKNGCELGVQYTTAQDFINSLWELYGNAKQIVDPLTRQLILADVIKEMDFRESMGTVCLLSDFIEKSSGLIDADTPSVLNLSTAEEKLVRSVLRYYEVLSENDLIEIGCAIELVRDYKDKFCFEFGESVILDIPICRFFSSEDIDQNDFRIANQNSKRNIDYKLLLATGASIKQGMVVKNLCDDINNPDYRNFAVVTSDPLSMLDMFEESAISSEVNIEIAGGIELASTDFGKFVLAICGMRDAKTDQEFIACASDLALSPYADINSFTSDDLKATRSCSDYKNQDTEVIKDMESAPRYYKAADLNTLWRSDRLLSREDISTQLCLLSNTFISFQNLLQGQSRDTGIFDKFSSIAMRRFSSTKREIELSAISRVQRIIDNALKFDITSDLIADLIVESNVSISFKKKSVAKDESVTILDYSIGSQMIASSFDVVYIDDVSSDVFNAKDEVSSIDALLKKLGCSNFHLSMIKARQRFFSILNCTSKKIVMCYSLRNNEGEENFTSFVFDELVSDLFDHEFDSGKLIEYCIKNEPVNDGLVLRITDGSFDYEVKGEEDLQQGIGGSMLIVERTELSKCAKRGVLGDCTKRYLLDRLDSHGVKRPILSASAVETYMSCPYKWFIEKRLKLSNLSDGIGSLEKGTFLHKVLELFYKLLIDDAEANGVLAKKSDEWIDETLDRIYSEVLEMHRELPLSENRYVPISEIELIEDQNQRELLKESVKLLKMLPLGYRCKYVELGIDAHECADNGIDYAGAYLNGKIDRIDVSPDNDAYYVIDYKGGINQHCAGTKSFLQVDSSDEANGEFADESKCEPKQFGEVANPFVDDVYPDHIQSLIYSRLLQKMNNDSAELGKCTGSLYASYKNKDRQKIVAGSYPSTMASMKDISNKDSMVDIDFNTFLVMVEQLVAVHVKQMDKGCIKADPHSENTCTYCAFRDCEARL